jgi:N-alpha-acetyltransferase 50
MVGCVSARVEKKDNEPTIYIMTLGVLSPYRRAKIGTKLIDFVEDYAKQNKIGSIYLHVQTNNDSAIKFYEKLGFINTEKIVGYYSRIEPPDCYVLVKKIGL